MEMVNADLFGSKKMDVDNFISPDTLMQPCDDMDVDIGTACAARSKPAIINKCAKRGCAKKAKKLEIA